MNNNNYLEMRAQQQQQQVYNICVFKNKLKIIDWGEEEETNFFRVWINLKLMHFTKLVIDIAILFTWIFVLMNICV